MDVRPSKPKNDDTHLHLEDYVGKIKHRSTVYVISSAFPAFVDKVWPTIPNNISFVLVTGAAITSVPFDPIQKKGHKSVPGPLNWTRKQFEGFINDPRIAHWFTQNAVARHPKLTAIPLGIDYRWLNRMRKNHSNVGGHAWGDKMSPQEQEQQLLRIVQAQKPWRERESEAYADFHLQMLSRDGPGSRRNALTRFKEPRIHWAATKTRMNRNDVWEQYGKHKFVVAPLGIGLDSYRVWECLILGSVPIVPESELVVDELYEGLPVLRVAKWEDTDVRAFEQSAVAAMMNSHWNSSASEKLTLEYWLRRIRKAASPPT
jgi:hypothetical protein